jgi:hypothetical protein
MRGLLIFLSLLAGCASADLEEGPDDPARWEALLGSDDPLEREEGAHRLALLGRTVHAPLADRDTASMRERLAESLQVRDPHQILWRAYHILRGGCLGRDWKRISDALAGQRFRLVEIYEPHERVKFVRFMGQPRAYVNLAGDPHDLVFWVQSVRRESGWIVREVYVLLHVEFEAPFKTLAARDRYPRGSVLAEFLELPEIRKFAVAYPILEEIELSYGRIRDKETSTVAAGFHVNAGFLTAADKGGGRGVYYTAEARLDPPTTPRGRLLRDGFAPDGALGPLTPRGASLWGAGGWKPPEDP